VNASREARGAGEGTDGFRPLQAPAENETAGATDE
jgi:hypothetical protein